MAETGSGRFEILGTLGEGGMGVVYEAYDRKRDMKVALKTMRRLEAGTLYHFKREFRAVSDLSHPNIVALYELIADGKECYFTMEIVRGDHILEYVRAGRTPEPSQPSIRPPSHATPSTMPSLVTVSSPNTEVMKPADAGAPRRSDPLAAFAPPTGPLPRVEDIVDLERVRHCFGQLARALDALHRVGLVHRDLKPSNVRVTDSGHTVLMDFGIVALESKPGRFSPKDRTVGTPAYMAPEQARGAAIDASADWYAFGVMLYEALTGRRPFEGSAMEILRAKMWQRPAPMGGLVRDLPRDLHTVCVRLLAREPAMRPSAADVLHCFSDRQRSVSRPSIPIRQRPEPAAFVGRAAELARLRGAYAEVRVGGEAWVFISGAPGMGKSALVHSFLGQLSGEQSSAGAHLEPEFAVEERTGEATDNRADTRAGPLIVRGRCHERETLTYNAFDGVVDSLSHALLALPQGEVDALLPEDIDLLARLFPVLRRVPSIEARERKLDIEPGDLRFRAALALRALIARLSRIRPVIIHIDDMHWADGDSWTLFAHLSASRAQEEDTGARLLLIGTLRTGPSAHWPRERIEELARHAPVHHLALARLTPAECTLLRERLGAHERMAVPRAVWDEAGGNPLLLVELARFAAESDGVGEDRSIDLKHVLYRRIARLPANERALFDAVCVAIEPLPLRVLAEAAGLDSEPGERALTYLRGRNFVQVQTPGPNECLLPYHEPIRQTALAYLDDARVRALHRAIAESLAREEHASLAALAEHWRAAGEPERARAYLLEAAELAHVQLAFDRAAELYRAALAVTAAESAADAPGERSPDATPDPSADASPNTSIAAEAEARRATLARLGNALQLAGKSYEAAQAYERAAAGAPAEQALELQRLAAENWLRSGHVEQGIEVLTRVLARLGVSYPRSRRRAIATLVSRRVRLRLRLPQRLRSPRVAAEIPAEALARLDTLYAAATTLGFIDHLRGAVLQTYHLERALELGHEGHVCRALAVDSAFVMGKRGGRDANRMCDRALERARELGDPYLISVVQLLRGGVQFFTGRASQAIESFSECEQVTGDVRQAVEWERVTARYLRSLAHIAVGDFLGAARTAERYTADAERRNDVYARTLFLCIPTTWRLLCQDQPDQADRNLDTAVRGWPDDRYYVAQYAQEFSRVLVMLYRGRDHGARALEQMASTARQADRLMLTRIPWIRGEVHTLMARAAILAGERDRARKSIRAIERVGLGYTDGMAALLRAALWHREGRRERAQSELEDALRHLREFPAAHLAAACEIRLGGLLDSSRGQELISRGTEALRACGVTAPVRMLDVLAPGFSD